MQENGRKWAGNGPEIGKKRQNAHSGHDPAQNCNLYLKIGFLTQKSIPLLPGVR